MTCTVEREDGALKSMTFSCDHPAGCTTPSPNDAEIMAAGGLKKMGWHCVGGKHYCPEHAEEARQ